MSLQFFVAVLALSSLQGSNLGASQLFALSAAKLIPRYVAVKTDTSASRSACAALSIVYVLQ